MRKSIENDARQRDAPVHEAESPQRRYHFGEFTLAPNRGALLRDDRAVRLRPKSFEVLRYLVENHGRLVSKDELFAAIWGNTIVTDGSLTQCLIDIRKAINDSSRQAIRTVPRRGYVFELPVTEGSTAPPIPDESLQPRRGWQLPVFLLLLTTIAAGWFAIQQFGRNAAPIDSAVSIPARSIAVLPFADMSEQGDHEYFGDGIAEEILNLLTKIPELHVVARTSSFSFKGLNPDIATIATRLNVAWILEGSVRRADSRVRVTAQLVDAASGIHAWSQNYDRELVDMLGVQTEIATAVADSLKVALVPPYGEDTASEIDAEAYERFLQGRFFYNRRGEGDVETAEDYFRQALAIDSRLAPAWAGLAGCYLVQLSQGSLEPDVGWPRMRDAVEEALASDPLQAEAHVRASQYFAHIGDLEKASAHRRQALELGQNNSLVLAAAAGDAAYHGKLEQAIDLQKRAVALDPLSLVGRGNLAYFLKVAGRYDEAVSEYQHALAIYPAAQHMAAYLGIVMTLQGRFDESLETIRNAPDSLQRTRGMALVYHALGRTADADAAMQDLASLSGVVAARSLAEVHAFRGDTEESFEWLSVALDRARMEASDTRERELMQELRLSPFLKPMHNEPRWRAIVPPVG
jgi:TolB-like protein/DNA-binding winged helix-turn-helix (wHTH) protein/tetratricopeptide (TPR) repeat protein